MITDAEKIDNTDAINEDNNNINNNNDNLDNPNEKTEDTTTGGPPGLQDIMIALGQQNLLPGGLQTETPQQPPQEQQGNEANNQIDIQIHTPTIDEKEVSTTAKLYSNVLTKPHNPKTTINTEPPATKKTVLTTENLRKEKEKKEKQKEESESEHMEEDKDKRTGRKRKKEKKKEKSIEANDEKNSSSEDADEEKTKTTKPKQLKQDLKYQTPQNYTYQILDKTYHIDGQDELHTTMAAIERKEIQLDHTNDLHRRALALLILTSYREEPDNETENEQGPKLENCRAAFMRQQFGELRTEHENQDIILNADPRITSIWRQQHRMEAEDTEECIQQLFQLFNRQRTSFTLTPPPTQQPLTELQMDDQHDDQTDMDIETETTTGRETSGNETAIEMDITEEYETSEQEILRLETKNGTDNE